MPITADPTQATGVRKKGSPRAGGFALIVAVAAISTSFPVYRFRLACISTGFSRELVGCTHPTKTFPDGLSIRRPGQALSGLRRSFRLGGSRGQHDRPGRNPGTPAIDRVGPIPFVGPGLEPEILSRPPFQLFVGRHAHHDVRIAQPPDQGGHNLGTGPSRFLTDGPGSNQSQEDG